MANPQKNTIHALNNCRTAPGLHFQHPKGRARWTWVDTKTTTPSHLCAPFRRCYFWSISFNTSGGGEEISLGQNMGQDLSFKYAATVPESWLPWRATRPIRKKTWRLRRDMNTLHESGRAATAENVGHIWHNHEDKLPRLQWLIKDVPPLTSLHFSAEVCPLD